LDLVPGWIGPTAAWSKLVPIPAASSPPTCRSAGRAGNSPGGKIAARVSQRQKGPRYRGPLRRASDEGYHLTSAGSLPPLAASLAITCLCSQTFIVAESLVSPV